MQYFSQKTYLNINFYSLPCIASRLHLLTRNANKVINFLEKFTALAYFKSSM